MLMLPNSFMMYKIVPFIFYFTRHTVHTKTSTAKKKSLKLWQFAGQESRSLAEKHHFGMLRVKNSSHQNQKKLPGFALF